MTQEEKAKAYDEAIKRAKDALNDGTISNNTIAYLRDVFPELKESEDERMRKGLIAFLEDIWYFGKNANFDKWNKSDVSDWMVWLGKKREKKQEWSEDDEKSTDNTNNVQPKFKVGDWILYSGDYYSGVRHITKIDENGYYIERNGLPHGIIPFNHEIHMRLWTIQDAKDGDIIYAKSKFKDFSFICIFFKLENGKSWGHCHIFSKNSKHWEFEYGKGFLKIDDYDFYPVSKEQRDLLFQKMKESDYEWDSESKEVTPLF